MSDGLPYKRVLIRVLPLLILVGLTSWCTANKRALYESAPAMAEIRELFVNNGLIDGNANDTGNLVAVAKRVREPGMNRILYDAAPKASLPALKWIVAHGAVPKNVGTLDKLPLLLKAAQTPHFDRLQYLLSLGFDPLERSLDGKTILHIAAQGELEDRVVPLLLSKGLKINDTDATGKTAMHYASVRSIPMLLNSGAEIDPKDDKGRTPLHLAVLDGKHELASALLLRHASVFAVDKQGRTALHLAALKRSNSGVIEILLTAGAPKTVRDNDGLTARDLAEMREENYQSSSIIDKL